MYLCFGISTHGERLWRTPLSFPTFLFSGSTCRPKVLSCAGRLFILKPGCAVPIHAYKVLVLAQDRYQSSSFDNKPISPFSHRHTFNRHFFIMPAQENGTIDSHISWNGSFNCHLGYRNKLSAVCDRQKWAFQKGECVPSGSKNQTVWTGQVYGKVPFKLSVS